MPWSDWIDIDSIKILSRHASVVAAVILLSKLIALLVEWRFKEGPVKTILEATEDIVVVGLFGWFVFQMAHLLWKRRVGSGPAASLLVA